MAHTHTIHDDDLYFVIDPDTRAITNASSNPPTIMQNDHNSELITFEIPKTVDGHAMIDCDTVKIKYSNTSTGTSSSTRKTVSGVYEVKDLAVGADNPDVLHCSWLIPQHATTLAGTLKFQLEFICHDTEDPSKVVYSWHSDIYESIAISAGLEVSEEISDVYFDMLENWESRLFRNSRYLSPGVDNGGSQYDSTATINVEDGLIYYVDGFEELYINVPETGKYRAYIFVNIWETYPDFKFHLPEGLTVYGSNPNAVSAGDKWEISLDSEGGAVFYQKRAVT